MITLGLMPFDEGDRQIDLLTFPARHSENPHDYALRVIANAYGIDSTILEQRYKAFLEMQNQSDLVPRCERYSALLRGYSSMSEKCSPASLELSADCISTQMPIQQRWGRGMLRKLLRYLTFRPHIKEHNVELTREPTTLSCRETILSRVERLVIHDWSKDMYSRLELKDIKERAKQEAKIEHPISRRDREWNLACLSMANISNLLMLMVESSEDDENHKAHLIAHMSFSKKVHGD